MGDNVLPHMSDIYSGSELDEVHPLWLLGKGEKLHATDFIRERL